MAIKVSGTTVIDDSRQLSNIAYVDATTVAALGSAGVGGGGTVELTAAANLSAGQTVVVNSSGQAAGVTETVGSVVFEDQLHQASTDIRYFDMAYFPNANYTGQGRSDGVFGCFYKRADNGYTYEKRYSVNSSTGELVSQGDQTLFSNSDVGYGLACTYSSGVNKALLVQANTSSNTINYRGVDYSGINYSSYSGANISHNYQSDARIALVYDASLDFFLMSADKASSILPIYVITLTSSAVANPASSTVSATNWTQNYRFPVMATDGNGQFVMLAFDGASATAYALPFTVNSSYTFTYGTKVAVANSGQNNDSMSIQYDKASGKFVMTARSSSGVDIRSLTVSNNSITANTATNVDSSQRAIGLVDGGEGRMGLVYSTYSSILYKPVSVASNGNITLGSSVTVSNSSGFDTSRNFKTVSTGENHSNFVAYVNFANAYYADLYGSEFAQTISSDSADFIGITTSAITSGATGDITVIGGLNDQQSGLTAGTKYYVTGTGTLTTTDSGVYAGRALSSTNLLVKG